MSTFWEVRAIRDWSAVKKGMVVEILAKDRTSKPYIKEIAEALTKKYGIKDMSSVGMSDTNFEFTKL